MREDLCHTFSNAGAFISDEVSKCVENTVDQCISDYCLHYIHSYTTQDVRNQIIRNVCQAMKDQVERQVNDEFY